jgi:hypothetical protein
MTLGSHNRGASLAVALGLCFAILDLGHAQTLSPGTPHTRLNWALKGHVIAAPSAGDPRACYEACEGTTACTGYSFDAHANPTCVLLSGTLVDVSAAGAMSCRKPCSVAIVPSGTIMPNSPKLAPMHPPTATLQAPAAAVSPPVNLPGSKNAVAPSPPPSSPLPVPPTRP